MELTISGGNCLFTPKNIIVCYVQAITNQTNHDYLFDDIINMQKYNFF